MTRTQPKLRLGRPVWFHHHGLKMRVSSFDASRRHLVITGSAAKLTVSQTDKLGTDRWFVDWEVIQSPRAKTTGRTVLNSDDLRAAFDVDNPEMSENDAVHFLFAQYGATAAKQGCYIRWEEWLNIPCPGTAHDGDPNISIFLDIAMREAVKTLTAPK